MKQNVMEDLFKLARARDEFPANANVVAAIARGSKIYSYGFNSYKTHPLQKRFAKNSLSIHLHAEIAAIKNYLRDNSSDSLKDKDLYVLRILKNGSLASAKPCEGCARAIIEFGFKNVFFTL